MDNKRTEKQKLKKLLKILIIVFAVLLLLLAVLYLLSTFLKNDEKMDYTKKEDGFYYFSADYEENPLNDEVYAAKNRYIMFTDHVGNGEPLTEENCKEQKIKKMFLSYFTSLMTGDARAHEDLLSDAYKQNFVVQKRFTPQKVYDIDIKFLMGDNDGDKYVERYQVSYKIYENNGTYRADIGSDVAKLMVFDVTSDNGKALINSIVPMNIK